MLYLSPEIRSHSYKDNLSKQSLIVLDMKLGYIFSYDQNRTKIVIVRQNLFYVIDSCIKFLQDPISMSNKKLKHTYLYFSINNIKWFEKQEEHIKNPI